MVFLVRKRRLRALIHLLSAGTFCSGCLNLEKEAEAAGYAKVLSADSEDTLVEALKSIYNIETGGPVLLEVRCACGARNDLGRPTTTPRENRDALMEFITKS